MMRAQNDEEFTQHQPETNMFSSSEEDDDQSVKVDKKLREKMEDKENTTPSSTLSQEKRIFDEIEDSSPVKKKKIDSRPFAEVTTLTPPSSPESDNLKSDVCDVELTNRTRFQMDKRYVNYYSTVQKFCKRKKQMFFTFQVKRVNNTCARSKMLFA